MALPESLAGLFFSGYFCITHYMPWPLCLYFMVSCNMNSNTNLFVVIIPQKEKKKKGPLMFLFFYLSRPWGADSLWLFWSRCDREINTAISLICVNHNVIASFALWCWQRCQSQEEGRHLKEGTGPLKWRGELEPHGASLNGQKLAGGCLWYHQVFLQGRQ